MRQFSGINLNSLIFQDNFTDVMSDIPANRGKMVETLNLLVLLGLGEGWSVASPEWRKKFKKQ